MGKQKESNTVDNYEKSVNLWNDRFTDFFAWFALYSNKKGKNGLLCILMEFIPQMRYNISKLLFMLASMDEINTNKK